MFYPQQVRVLTLFLCVLFYGCSRDSVDQSVTPESVISESVTPAPGFNLSGFEFGSSPSTGSFPTQQDLQTYADYGATMVRIPFRWEYFADQSGNLSGSGASYLSSVDALAKQAVTMGLTVMLDLHNYMRYCPNAAAGSCGTIVTGSQLAAVWQTIVSQVSVVQASPDQVWLDLMNEPNGISASSTLDLQAQAVAGLRTAGITNRVVFEGTSWTGLHSWQSSGNSTAFTATGIETAVKNYASNADPAPYAIEVHQYLDTNFSGTQYQCVSSDGFLDAINFSSFMNWVQSNQMAVILGEFGGAANGTCMDTLQTLMTQVTNNPYSADSGGFLAWTAWGGGHAWGNNYLMGLVPIDSSNTPGVSQAYITPQLDTLAPFLGKTNPDPDLYTTVQPSFSSFGTCGSGLISVNITNDLGQGVASGNFQYQIGSGPVDVPLGFSLANAQNNQEATFCLPTGTTELIFYPAPNFQPKTIPIGSDPSYSFNLSQYAGQ